jgi:hypothetical protein
MSDNVNENQSPLSRWIGWLLLALIITELFYLYSNIQNVGTVAQLLVLSLFVLGWRFLKLREIYLLIVCLILFALVCFSDQSTLEITFQGLSRAAYLASFILLMALLREGALTSPSVLKVGTFLTRQPSSRRFVSLFAGGHFFAVLINLGSLSLLAPIIQRGVRSDIPQGEPLDEILLVRERRQLTATMRGFSWFLVWAPTAVTQAVMPTLMSGIDATRLMTTGLGLAILMFFVSWAEDKLRWQGFANRLKAEGRLPAIVKTRFPKKAFQNLGFVCLALFGLSISFSKLADVTIVTGVMLTSPIVVCAWIYLQQTATKLDQRLSIVANRLDEITFTSMPGYIREAMFIACAGFIGTLAAKLVPATVVATAIGLANLDGWIVLWALTVSVWVFGQVGLSPITMAVFLGSLVAELPNLPVDITYAALAIAAGTAVCTAGAPFSAGALMLSRATGHSPFTLTWRWNGTYTVVSIAVLGIYYWVLTSI